jgi:hypothetical protein
MPHHLYYFAASTDSGCILGCTHEHKTVSAAVACISSPYGYVIGVENGALRSLTEEEEVEFEHAMYGRGDADMLLIALLTHLLKLPIWFGSGATN